MIKAKLGYLMLDHKIKSVTMLARETGISRETLRKIYNETKLESLSLETIVKLCEFFNCKIQDLIEYIPDDQKDDPNSTN